MECDRRHVEQQEERRDPLHYRLFKAFLRGSFEGSQNAPRMKIADAEGIRQITEKLVRKVASEGNCVIVGRGSAYYLRDTPDSFHVFIFAPFEEKVRRVQQGGKSEEEAVQLVETVDQDRKAFIKQHFGIECAGPAFLPFDGEFHNGRRRRGADHPERFGRQSEGLNLADAVVHRFALRNAARVAAPAVGGCRRPGWAVPDRWRTG